MLLHKRHQAWMWVEEDDPALSVASISTASPIAVVREGEETKTLCEIHHIAPDMGTGVTWG